MRNYKVLDQDTRDDIIVEFFEAQERDLHCFLLNKERYEAMLEHLEDGPFRKRIEKLLAETNQRIAEVEAIIAATEKQLPGSDRIAAAKQRLQAKRAGNA